MDSYYKSSDQILTVDHSFRARGDWASNRTSTYIFDFEFRTMTVVSNFSDYSQSDEQASVHPFPTVDAEVLERMRDKLVELGGKPDPLTGSTAAKPPLPAPRNTQKGLNP